MKQSLTIRELPQLFGQCRYAVINGEPALMGRDLCKAIGIVNPNDALGRLEDDEKIDGVAITDPIGRRQEATFVTESGMYHLIFQSRKPEAKAFRKWVTSDVLPSIRKNGYYIVPGAVVSAADIRRMENNMYKFLKEYVTGEDITRLARKFGVRKRRVEHVLWGWVKDYALMERLQECAQANQASRAQRPGPYSLDKIKLFNSIDKY